MFFPVILIVGLILPPIRHVGTTSTSSTATADDGKNVVITDKNWEQILTGEWMLKFYAPWCPACRAMEETWHKLASWAAHNSPSPLKVGDIDVTSQVALNGRFMITKLPTIYHVVNGEFRQYAEKRELEDFISFVGNEEWTEVSPVSSWTSPTSFIMTCMSKLFTFSMDLKSYHSYLSSEHGFPQWLSMLLFGTLIILVGLLLGIVFVLASDYFWGPPQYHDSMVEHKKDDDALVMDEVEDVARSSEVCHNDSTNGGDDGAGDDGGGQDVEFAKQPVLETDLGNSENNLRQRNVKGNE